MSKSMSFTHGFCITNSGLGSNLTDSVVIQAGNVIFSLDVAPIQYVNFIWDLAGWENGGEER